MTNAKHTVAHTPTAFSIKRDQKGNPQLYGYGGLALMAQFYPGGFPSDAEMHATAGLIVRACNAHDPMRELLTKAVALMAVGLNHGAYDNIAAGRGYAQRVLDASEKLVAEMAKGEA